jgi:5-methylcytosine-specific restriction enzyme subunit McrC
MLVYAFTELKQTDIREMDAEAFKDIHNLFAAILSENISHLIKRGLYKEYVKNEDSMSIVHGKIDIPNTIKEIISQNKRIVCEFDEFTEDNTLNQILKTAISIILKGDIDSKYKKILMKDLFYLSNVNGLRPSSINWSSLKSNRNNQHYYPLVNFCQILFQGMLPTTDDGNYKLNDFIDNATMASLYEAFVRKFYEKELKYSGVKTSHGNIEWALDDDNDKLLPKMNTDIELSKDNDHLIIDTKLYEHPITNYHGKDVQLSTNMYQIFSYVKNKESNMKNVMSHKVSGMLLYAKTNDEVSPDVHYMMSGNEISVCSIDLNKDFNNISGKLIDIVNKHFKLSLSLPK